MATSPPFPFLSFLKTLKASIAKSLSPISEETQVSVSAITCKSGQAETSNLSSSTLCRRLRMFWWRYLKPRWLDISLTLVKRASYGWSWFVSFQKVVLEHREDIRSFKRMERNTYRTNFLERRNFPHIDCHLAPIRRMEWDKKKHTPGTLNSLNWWQSFPQMNKNLSSTCARYVWPGHVTVPSRGTLKCYLFHYLTMKRIINSFAAIDQDGKIFAVKAVSFRPLLLKKAINRDWLS